MTLGIPRGCSLDAISLLVLKAAMRFFPTAALGHLTKLSRKMIRLALNWSWSSRLRIKQLSDTVDELSYRVGGFFSLFSKMRNDDNDSNDAILFIHGGGFNFCDSLDIMICEHLLPLLSSRMPNRSLPKLFTVLYDLPPSPQNATFFRVQQQVLDAYLAIKQSGRKVVAVIGDSAGGNLAIGLLYRLRQLGIVESTEELPYGVLLSPWVDVFDCLAKCASPPAALAKQDTSIDYVDPQNGWLWASLYVGEKNAHIVTQALTDAIKISLKEIQLLTTDAAQENGEPILPAATSAASAMLLASVSRLPTSQSFALENRGISKNVTVGQLCPLYMSDDDLRQMPPCLVIAGGNERLIFDIQRFSGRLLSFNTHSKLLVGENDIHVYPAFFRNPVHQALSRWWLGWLLWFVAPKSRRIGYSDNAEAALIEMAEFLQKAIIAKA